MKNEGLVAPAPLVGLAYSPLLYINARPEFIPRNFVSNVTLSRNHYIRKREVKCAPSDNRAVPWVNPGAKKALNFQCSIPNPAK